MKKHMCFHIYIYIYILETQYAFADILGLSIYRISSAAKRSEAALDHILGHDLKKQNDQQPIWSFKTLLTSRASRSILRQVYVGASWGALGRSWGALWVLLERSWGCLEAF